MQAAEQKVKGQSPIRQVCEIAKGLFRLLGSAVRPVPTEDVEDGDESVGGEKEAQACKYSRRQQPRGCVPV